MKVLEHEHPIQITIMMSGLLGCDIHPVFGETCSYFSGSGMSPGYVEYWPAGQHLSWVNIEIEPAVLESFFSHDRQRQSDEICQLFKGEEWKVAFYPKVTPAIRSLAQQIWNVPYQGAAKRMYLQAKVWDLLLMYLELLTSDQERTAIRLRPDTVARLQYAKEILTQQLEHPPMLLDLARQVGVSERTLRRGFQELFGMSPLRYLTQLRMQQARYLLQQGTLSVAEVARTVGYGSLGHFAAAFKREFGITPSGCMGRKMAIQ